MDKFGICHLAYFPIREQPNHRAEIISVVLFGEHFKISNTESDWYYIQLAFDKYEGWVTSNELRYIDLKQFEEISNSPKFYSNEVFQKVESDDKSFYIGFGSALPFLNDRNVVISEDKFYVSGEFLEVNKGGDKNFVYRQTLKLLNVPYLWGGRNSFGTDCSGLVQTAYKFIDIDLPRNAYMQKETGSIIEIEKAGLGDLAFFVEDGNTTHVGMLIDNNSIIHASGKVRIDKFDKNGIFNEEIGQYTHQLEIIKRL